jgi:hypothetical protein
MYDFKRNYFELESWKKWYVSFAVDIPVQFKGSSKFKTNSNKNVKQVEYDDDIAVEVLVYRKSLIHFGG